MYIQKSHEENRPTPPPAYTPSSAPPAQPPISSDSPVSGNKLTADEISKGLGLDD